jgi:hypothetical protein
MMYLHCSTLIYKYYLLRKFNVAKLSYELSDFIYRLPIKMKLLERTILLCNTFVRRDCLIRFFDESNYRILRNTAAKLYISVCSNNASGSFYLFGLKYANSTKVIFL